MPSKCNTKLNDKPCFLSKNRCSFFKQGQTLEQPKQEQEQENCYTNNN